MMNVITITTRNQWNKFPNGIGMVRNDKKTERYYNKQHEFNIQSNLALKIPREAAVIAFAPLVRAG